MDPAHLIAFNVTLLAAMASPGPSLLYLMRTTLVQGRAAGMWAACGLAVMAAGWTAAALAGLDAVFRAFPVAYGTLKLFGALYLLRLAWLSWKHADDPLRARVAPSHRSTFLSGMLVNLGNPKSMLFAAAVIVVIFPAGLSVGDKTLIALNHLAVELAIQPLIVLALSAGGVARLIAGWKPVVDRVVAGLLGALGLRLLADRWTPGP